MNSGFINAGEMKALSRFVFRMNQNYTFSSQNVCSTKKKMTTDWYYANTYAVIQIKESNKTNTESQNATTNEYEIAHNDCDQNRLKEKLQNNQIEEKEEDSNEGA